MKRLALVVCSVGLLLLATRCGSPYMSWSVADPPATPKDLIGVKVAALAPIDTDSGGYGKLCVIEVGGRVQCAGLVYPSLAAATDLAGDHFNVCGLFADRTLRCVDAASPDGPAMTVATDVAQASGRCFLTGTGSASCIDNQGKTSPVPLGGAVARQVAAQRNVVCALLADGTVRCWPGDLSGAGLAVGGVAGASQIAVHTTFDDALPWDRTYHGCALVDGGQVRCWGNNVSGQLGDGTTKDAPATAVTVIASEDKRPLGGATAVAAGAYLSCARTAAGVRCWGVSGVFAAKDAPAETTAATPVPGVPAVAALRCVERDGCALLADMTVTCWGGAHTESSGGNSGSCLFIPGR